MSAGEFATHLAALWAGIFATMYGLAFWIAGFANPRTSSFQCNFFGATCITAGVFMLAYSFTGYLPY